MLQSEKSSMMRGFGGKRVEGAERQGVDGAHGLPPNRRRSALANTAKMRRKPEIGFDCGCGFDGVSPTTGCEAASCAFKLLANWPISCCATSWIMPDARPYCATAPESVRSVFTRTRVPRGEGSRRKSTFALAPPRPLESLPCAL